MSCDRTIETYIERLLAWKEPITAQTLDELATEIGLSPDDIAAIHKQAQDHLSRGKNYLGFDCFDEAIEELTQAASLDPLNLEILQTLAAAHEGRYQKNKKTADKTAAIQTAKRCLGVAPDDVTATKLIASLETPKKFPLKSVIGGLGTLLLVVGVYGSKPIIKLLFSSSNSLPPIDIELDIPERDLNLDDILPDSSVNSAPQAAETTTDTPSTALGSDNTPEVDIPVIFEQPGLTIEPRLSRLSNYDDSSFYKLQGVLVNESDQEIDSLRLQVDYLDKAGNVLLSDSTMALDTHEGMMRPGDHHAFDLIKKINPTLTQVRLSVTTIDQLPAPASYPTAQLLNYTWPSSDQSPGIKFELTRRRENFSTYSASDGYFDADWGITNTGDQAIRGLKLAVTFYSENNRKLSVNEVFVVSSSDTALLPGEVRPIHVIEQLADTYKRYEVNVIEAE
ncbi:MAG: hypothetical protein AAFN42_12315 [Cyanobacteria bacterium J06554_1]